MVSRKYSPAEAWTSVHQFSQRDAILRTTISRSTPQQQLPCSTMLLETFPGEAALPTVGLVQGLPNAVYHRIDAVSQTQLKAFRKSPLHFDARFNREVPAIFGEEPGSDEMFAGTLCHCATLEPELYAMRYAVGPVVKTRNAKEWREAVEANPRRVLITPRQHAVAMAQAASLRSLEAVAEILEGGQCEVSAFWIDTATGLRCRCRPDCANDTFGSRQAPKAMLLDVKTTRDASRRAVQQTIARYGYHHQAEWYSRGYAEASGVPVAGFVFAFVENEFPFAAAVYELDIEAYEIAARENRETLDALARCRRDGQWPGYPPDVENVGLPRWAGGTGEYY
jgi:hypothetical protein